jgi:uncharacterized protein YbaA (DUF1428 family)
MPGYVDGFVIPVPKRKVAAYRRMAALGERIWRKHGALDYKECIGDDLAVRGGPLSFPRGIRAKPGETVFFSFIVYKSRAHRDRVNARVMKDPELLSAMKGVPMPFDFRRMLYGGFRVLVDFRVR